MISKFWFIQFLLVFLFVSKLSAQEAQKIDTAQIEKLTGLKGTYTEKSGVFRVSAPRSDLSLNVADVKITPPLGITSWAAFQQIGNDTEVMGDLVLTEDQVHPVMKTALDSGLSVTALHNHFFWDSPKIMFMHIEGMGKTKDLATSVGTVFKVIKETSATKPSTPTAQIDPTKSTLDPQKIEKIIGTKGTLSKGVYKIVLGRTTTMHGHEMGSDMGVNTWAAFAGSDDQAVMLGDFAMKEDEVQNVLKALLKNKIYVVALHHHMLGENPRIIFLHYWGIGSTKELAKGLKEALAQIQ